MNLDWQIMVFAISALTVLAILFGALLGFSSVFFKVEGNPIVDQIDALLPQTQCGQCGYPGCRPYAESIAGGEAINKCPPGGEATIQALADLLDVEPLPLDAENSDGGIKKVAVIREAECIGCTKCIQACPVDAIVGAAKHMHTVIANECTGCDLCLEPCPVDCIDMVPVNQGITGWRWTAPGHGEPVSVVDHSLIIATDRRDLARQQALATSQEASAA